MCLDRRSYVLIALLAQGWALADSPAELGRILFFDARLSGDGSRSCAHCHDPAQGFSKQFDAEGSLQRLSEGYTGSRYFRNAPTLINVHSKQEFGSARWGWDGRMQGTLSEAISLHLESPRIMNMDPLLLRERIKQEPRYIEMCRGLFEDECRHSHTLEALSAFLATIHSVDAPTDCDRLSPTVERGRKLFDGKAGCRNCHTGWMFSDFRPHNTGVPENPEVFSDPLRHLNYRSMLVAAGIDNSGAWRRDVGYFALSGDSADIGSFITPSLRELRYTAPYMHNGIFESLQEVIEFYDRGSDGLPPLGLSLQEKDQLLAFLLSLSSAEPIIVKIEEVSSEYLPMEAWLEQSN